MHTGVCSNAQDDDADDEDDAVDDALDKVLAFVPVALLDQLEPEGCGEVERETRDEQARRDGEQVREEGNGLGNDPGDQGDDRDERQPGDPAHLGVDVADNGVLEDAAVDVARHDGRVDGARDEDDGQRDAKGDLGDGAAGREQRRGLHVLADEDVDERARDGVDEDLNGSEGDDRLGEVLRGVHLVHEGELAQGETVRKDDVSQGHKGLGQTKSLLGP